MRAMKWFGVVVTLSILVNGLAFGGTTVMDEHFDYADTDALRTVWLGSGVLETEDPEVASVPYMSLGNYITFADLSQTVTGDFDISWKVGFTADNRAQHLWVMNDAGTQGYGCLVYNGTGPCLAYVNKFDDPNGMVTWRPWGETFGFKYLGYNYKDDGKFVPMRLTWDSATGDLTMYCNGSEIGTYTDTSFSSFSKIYLVGNSSGLFDDIVMTTSVETVSAPVFSPEQNHITGPTPITIISQTPGASIYYTVDGTTPTVESNFYTEPVVVNIGTELQAIALKDGCCPSSVTRVTYVNGLMDEHFDYADNDGLQTVWSGGELVTDDPDVEYEPYLKLGNQIVHASLNQMVTGDFDISWKVGFTADNRAQHLWVMNDAGTQGYGCLVYNGTGACLAYVNKFDDPNGMVTWRPSGETFGFKYLGYNYKDDGKFVPMRLTWDSATGNLTMYCNGNEIVTYTDTSFSSFSKIYLVGNSYGLFDDILVLTTRAGTADPVFSPDGKYVTGPTSITMTCETPGANIYYTVDGTTPTASSNLYTEPVVVNIGTELKAIAVAGGCDPSFVTSMTYANYNRPVEIPSGSVTVDGDLADWSDAEWAPLDQLYMSTASDVAEAYYSAKWQANKMYVAVKVRDTAHFFMNEYVDWNARDAIELYLHTDGEGPDSYPDCEIAQAYAVGFKASSSGEVWTAMCNNQMYADGNVFAFPEDGSLDNIIKARGSIDGEWLQYEIEVTPFTRLGLISGAEDIVATLAADDEIGLDVCVVAHNGDYFTGMKSENMMSGKGWSWPAFGMHKLVAEAIPGDANGDGMVDVGDLGILAANYGGTGKTWSEGDFNGDSAVDVGDLGILAAHYGEGVSGAVDFDVDYAKVFGEMVAGDEENDGSSSICSGLGLPLIAGLVLAMLGLTAVRLSEE
jgi:hypothetical protein